MCPRLLVPCGAESSIFKIKAPAHRSNNIFLLFAHRGAVITIMTSMAVTRLQKEVKQLQADPPPGVWAAPKGDDLMQLEAKIEVRQFQVALRWPSFPPAYRPSPILPQTLLQGPSGTVYEGGIFKLEVDIPPRYPIEPPKVRFTTKIYHPNIDPDGRICLDTLNPPPKGAWKPSLNVGTVLASIGLLMADPNPDDGLIASTAHEFKHQREVFDAKAKQWTKAYAGQGAAREEQAGVDAAKPPTRRQQQQGGGEGGDPGKENADQGSVKPPSAAAPPPKRSKLSLR